jgi:hypothetical protein
VFPTLLREIFAKYTNTAELGTMPGEQARGYIDGKLYALRDDGTIVSV